VSSLAAAPRPGAPSAYSARATNPRKPPERASGRNCQGEKRIREVASFLGRQSNGEKDGGNRRCNVAGDRFSSACSWRFRYLVRAQGYPRLRPEQDRPGHRCRNSKDAAATGNLVPRIETATATWYRPRSRWGAYSRPAGNHRRPNSNRQSGAFVRLPLSDVGACSVVPASLT
jgi:hypothetical protein